MPSEFQKVFYFILFLMKNKFEKYNYFDKRDNLNRSTSIILIENKEQYRGVSLQKLKISTIS